MICPRCGYDNLPGSDECAGCLFDLATLDHPVGHDRVESSLLSDPVGQLAHRAPVTLTPDAPVRRAIQLMIDEGVGALLVTNSSGLLVGIFSERDLLGKVVGAADLNVLP